MKTRLHHNSRCMEVLPRQIHRFVVAWAREGYDAQAGDQVRIVMEAVRLCKNTRCGKNFPVMRKKRKGDANDESQKGTC
jgi:hypothetical protein